MPNASMSDEDPHQRTRWCQMALGIHHHRPLAAPSSEQVVDPNHKHMNSLQGQSEHAAEIDSRVSRGK